MRLDPRSCAPDSFCRDTASLVKNKEGSAMRSSRAAARHSSATCRDRMPSTFRAGTETVQ